MANKVVSNKKSPFANQQNPLEVLKDAGDIQQEMGESQAFGFEHKKTPQKRGQEFSLFNYQEYYENNLIKNQIKELSEAIRKEISLVKKADQSLIEEISEAQKISLETLPDKAGVYHVRFLEIVLKLLQSVRAKIGESRTWLQAMMSKKKKRGSLFASLSKKKGTQYSLSQEISSARSIQ
jgi:hypothetical protein